MSLCLQHSGAGWLFRQSPTPWRALGLAQLTRGASSFHKIWYGQHAFSLQDDWARILDKF